MNNIRTVSDTKRAFYTIHTRPINSIYRRVVEELMVEMHLLSVNADFRYDPIYALGVVSTFDRFMHGYRPEQDRDSIFNGLCRSLENDPQRYRDDAEQIKAEVGNWSIDNFLSQIENPESFGSDGMIGVMKQVRENPNFKYSRLFATGLYTILETLEPAIVSSETRRNEVLEKIGTALGLPNEKIQKDLELYRSNLEKITQAQAVLNDLLVAERKKREERAQAQNSPKQPVPTPPEETSESA